MAMYYEVETRSGVIKLKKPMGRAGAIHFGIITKYMPANKKAEGDPLSPMEQERIGQGFEEWTGRVLPQLLVSYTPKDGECINPVTVDELSGEDQYAAFLAICSTMENDGDFFRIL